MKMTQFKGKITLDPDLNGDSFDQLQREFVRLGDSNERNVGIGHTQNLKLRYGARGTGDNDEAEESLGGRSSQKCTQGRLSLLGSSRARESPEPSGDNIAI